jgi:hypothetical protein
MGLSVKIGDLIIEPDSGSIGVIIKRKRKIYIETIEAYYWIIHWFNSQHMPAYIEEKYLTNCLEKGILKKQ